MPDMSDMELLQDYARHGSEAAFAGLVQRHVNLVYSAALRQVGIAAHAEEITQAVFVILARKAARLRPDTILEAWFYQTTRLTSLSFLRGERRRQWREQEAFMQSALQESGEPPIWNQLAPLLDEAMSRLGKTDREAVVLRYFKGKSLHGVAAALKTTEAAAQSRVHRAVEKLRKYFLRRGIDSTTAAITGAISANSIQAAPVALAKSITAVAFAKGATASTSTLTLIKGALKIMAWTKMKTAIVAGAVVILAATSTTVIAVRVARAHRPVAEPVTDLSPITQMVTADIQPDGAILFQGTVEETNNTSQTIATDSINDADVTWLATDDSGKPMKITKRPRGGIFVALNRAVPPGGTISYTVEGKAAGFLKKNGAGEYEVGMSGDIGNVTEAHVVEAWRLPAGAVLMGKGRGLKETTNADRIELRIDTTIPPKGPIPISFRYRLPTNAN
jgi:RNA polymerase sigma factor (sigma-70 family)